MKRKRGIGKFLPDFHQSGRNSVLFIIRPIVYHEQRKLSRLKVQIYKLISSLGLQMNSEIFVWFHLFHMNQQTWVASMGEQTLAPPLRYVCVPLQTGVFPYTHFSKVLSILVTSISFWKWKKNYSQVSMPRNHPYWPIREDGKILLLDFWVHSSYKQPHKQLILHFFHDICLLEKSLVCMQGTNTDYITSSGKSFLFLFCSQWYFYSHFLSVCDFSKAVQNYFPSHFIIKWFLRILGSFKGQRRAPACSCRPTVIGNHLS